MPWLPVLSNNKDKSEEDEENLLSNTQGIYQQLGQNTAWAIVGSNKNKAGSCIFHAIIYYWKDPNQSERKEKRCRGSGLELRVHPVHDLSLIKLLPLINYRVHILRRSILPCIQSLNSTGNTASSQAESVTFVNSIAKFKSLRSLTLSLSRHNQKGPEQPPEKPGRTS